MASSYPGALDTFTTKVNKQDSYDASDMNEVQNAVVAMQTEAGIDVAGTKTDLVTRLAQCLATNGAMRSGTSNPTVPTPQDGDFFYRTDENVMYIYNGATWDSQGQSLSNVLFSLALGGEVGSVLSLTVSNTTLLQLVWGNVTGSYVTVVKTKFKKLAGVSTVTVYAHVATTDAANGDIQVIINPGGSQVTGTSEVNADSFSWAWATLSAIDVSGLSDGTVYDVEIQLKNDSGAATATIMDSIIGFGS